jgi:hypothetical protein
VKRMVVAAVVAASVAIVALPILAQSDNPTNSGDRAVVAPLGGGPEPGGRPMHGDRMMRRMGMMRQMRMMRATPQQRCAERLAHRAGMRAYVGAMLNLTAQQRPLWDKVDSAARSEEEKEGQLCAGLASKPAGFPDRLAHMEQFLEMRLAALRSAKPAVDDLYQSLTPQQRMVIDHPFRRP